MNKNKGFFKVTLAASLAAMTIFSFNPNKVVAKVNYNTNTVLSDASGLNIDIADIRPDKVENAEDYILANVNKIYANPEKLDVADLLYVKHLIADKNEFTGEISIDAMYESQEDAFIFMNDFPVVLYNVDDNSDYYVAYANTLIDDLDYEVADTCFAYFNLYAELIDDAIYDSNTGLAYIPKKYTEENKNEVAMNVQVEFLQLVDGQNPTSTVKVEMQVDEELSGDYANSGKATVEALAAEFGLKIALDENSKNAIDEDYLKVYIDDKETHGFKYYANSGILVVDSLPNNVDKVTINISKENIEENQLYKEEKNISSYMAGEDIPMYTDAGVWYITDELREGDSFYMEGDSSKHWNAELVDVYHAGSVYLDNKPPIYNIASDVNWTSICDLILNDKNINISNLTTNPSYFQHELRFNADVSSSGLTIPAGTHIWLKCSHSSSYFTSKSYREIDHDGDPRDYAFKIKVRVLKITDDYLLLGFLTGALHTQSGTGIYKIAYTTESGNLEVAKKNKYGECVPGAVLAISGPEDFYQEITTGTEPTLIEKVKKGTYTVTEITAPVNMIKNETPVTVEVAGTGNTPAVLVDDYQRGSATFKKIDADHPEKTLGDARIAGAKYNFYAAEEIKEGNTIIYAKDQLIKENILTKDDGTTDPVTDLPIGNYYYKEITPSEGFILNNEIVPVSIVYDGQLAPVARTGSVEQAEKPIYCNLEIYKVLAETDYDPEIALAGCKFKLTLKSDNTQVYYTNLSIADGICKVEDIPYGTYSIEEVEWPDEAFKVDPFELKLEKDKTEYTYTYKGEDRIKDKPKEMIIEVYKNIIDEAKGKTDASIADAFFTVYLDELCTKEYKDKNGQTVIIGPTDVSGYAKSKKMRTGTYYIKETVFPRGTDQTRYLPNEKVSAETKIYKVSPKNTDQTDREALPIVTTINPKNVPELGRVQIIKFNDGNAESNNSPAKGAKLRLTLDSNPNCYYDAEVDENGFLEFNNPDLLKFYAPYSIPYGKYTLTEIKESDNGNSYFYYIQNESININIKNETEKRIVSDDTIDSYLKVIKVDEDTDKVVKLDGAIFKVWDIQNNCWLEQVTMEGKKTEFKQEEKTGIMYFPEKLEAGEYILYEVESPKGYYLPEKYRVPEDGIGGKDKGGKAFKISKVASGIEEDTEATVPTLVVDVEMYDEELKGKIEIYKTGEKLVDSKTSKVTLEENGEKYDVVTPIYEEKPLKNAFFEIRAAEDIYSPDKETKHYSKGQVVETVSTGDDGYAKSKDLFLGKYEIVEVESPAGYVIDEKATIVTLTNDNPYERVKVEKVDETNTRQILKLTLNKAFEATKYSDSKEDKRVAVFKVSAAEDIKNYEGKVCIQKDQILFLIHSLNGVMDIEEMDLPAATYNVEEVYASVPYTISETVLSVKVLPGSATVKEVVANAGTIENTTPSTELYLVKLPANLTLDDVVTYKGDKLDDSKLDEKVEALISDIKTMDFAEIENYLQKNKYGLPGARYQMFTEKTCTKPLYMKKDGEMVEAILESKDSGLIEIGNIPLGKYYIKEIVSPDGYEVDRNIHEIILATTDKGKMVFVPLVDNAVIGKSITKTDVFTGEAIADCVFEITDADDNVVLHSVTNEKGEGYFPITMFDNGETYYYKEISAPDIYDLNTEEKHEFVAKYEYVENENGDFELKWTADPIKVNNRRKEQKVTLIKTDMFETTLIPNCKFELRSLENKDWVVEGVTDEKGEYVFENVPYGKYTYTELEAPEEYEIDTTPHEFEVGDKPVVLYVTNNLKTGDIAVMALTGIALVSVLGIVFVVIRKKARK